MKKLLFLFILMLSPILASADDGDMFSEETVEGVLLKYTIISESEKTCMVGETYYPAVPTARVRRGPEDEVCQISGDITIPEEANGYRVVRVESFAFNQAAITSVFIPNSVKTIGNSAFTGCADLKSVRLSEQLARIEGFTFYSCESLTNIDIPEGVTSIGDYAFANCKQLEEITIPSSVEHFGEDVFWNTGFTSLPKLPESLTVIPKSMFYACAQLTSIEIPKNITKIGECAFGRCPISEIEIPASVTHVGVAAFTNCKNITDLTIPDNVTEIGFNAFNGCSNLKTVKLSANITSLNQGIFTECSSLESIIIPNGVKSIGKFAFQGCSSLSSINLPETVEEIGEEAFYGCSSLTKLFIPKSFVRFKTDENNIYWSFIYGCTSLTSIVVDKDNPIFDSRDNCNAIIETASNTLVAGCITTTIPEGITTIGYFAFGGFKDLTSITLPQSLNRIEKNAFNGSGLQEIKIPGNVTYIGAYAFSSCNSLKDFYCCAEKVPEAESAFGNTNLKEVTLHVPAASVSAYQAVDPWKKFKEIVALTNNSDTQDYFPEGTKWTEIRLDTLKYDSWYSKVGDEWVPNFETIEYYVKGEYPDMDWVYKKVYTNGPEWTDSLTLLIREVDNLVEVTVLVQVQDGEFGSGCLLPGQAYDFDWSVGKGLYYRDITISNTTIFAFPHTYYGVIDEIKEGYFGGVKPLKYADLDGKAPKDSQYPRNGNTNGGRIIQGIGITEWKDGECLFGPPNPYYASTWNWGDRHYRSMLVHFERNGEVLYDVWPEKGETYRPFVEEDKVWKVGSATGISDGIVKMVEYYYFDGDTIINEKTCKQMMCQRYVSPNHPDYAAMAQIPSLRYVGAWYEEDKKVHFYNSTNKQFEMKYDFSLETNDTLLINNDYHYVIGPKQTGGLNGFKGDYRDIMWIDGEHICTTWLEGVGGIDGPTTNVYYGAENHPLFLMSCTVGDEVIYLNDEYEDGATLEAAEARKNRFDFTHTIKTQPKAPSRRGEDISLYGEYSNRQLDINLDPLADAYQVRITDESGEVVYEKSINAGTIVGLSIDISAYAKGRYTVTVENSRETFTGEFNAQVTGINAITNNKGEIRYDIYNLHGQRLSSLQKGLNIVNGQKIFVK